MATAGHDSARRAHSARGLRWGRLVLFAAVAAWGAPLAPEPLAQSAPASWPELQAQMGRRVGGGEKDAALLVAVQDYRYISKVPGALQNLQDWRLWLQKVRGVPEDAVETLTEAKVTPGSLLKAAKLAALQVKKGGTLWFVFIGHGVVNSDGQPMFVAYDARQSDEVYALSAARAQLVAALSQGQQAQTVVVADTCFGGGQDHAGRRFVTGGQAMVPMKDGELSGNVVLLSAGGAGQQTGPLPGTRRPAYSYLVLGGLMGWADGVYDDKVDGAVTVGETTRYAQKALARLEERTQEPEFYPASAGGSVLARGTVARVGPNVKALMALPMLAAEAPVAPVVACPVGTRFVEGRCVVEAVSCPEGTRVVEGKCVAAAQCPAGTVVRDGKCVVTAVECPAGSQLDGERCVGPAAPRPAVAQVEEEERPPAEAPEGMVVISRGPVTFMMGGPGGASDETGPDGGAVRVTLSGGYALDRTEVTVAAYKACVLAGKCKQPKVGTYCNYHQSSRHDHPANCVSWHDAVAYCDHVAKRLPTEAEWEYAARSGERGWTYPWGDEQADCGRAVMEGSGADGCGADRTSSVCSKPRGRSVQGACDLAGNVEEWVSDAWTLYGMSTRSDPHERGKVNDDRIARGGNWISFDPSLLRAAIRYHYPPSDGYLYVGFRCARTI